MTIVKSEQQRRLHKAFLRYHDPKGWPMLREALERMGRADLIGNGKHHLIPTYQPQTDEYQSARRKNSTPAGSKKVGGGDKGKTVGRILTQHTGLPPRGSDGSKSWDKREQAKAAAEARRKAEKAGAGKPVSKKPSKRPVAPR